MASLLIRGGRIIDPASDLDARGDILIRDGVLEKISPDGSLASTADQVLNAEGCLVTPGLIDPHVHLREPSHGQGHRETIARGAAAALAGGFTTVCSMPNTSPPPDCPERVQDLVARGIQAGAARVFPVACGTIGRAGESPTAIADLVAAGACGISDDGDGVEDDQVMDRILEQVAHSDTCFMQHCQDPELTRDAVMNAGPVALRLGLQGWPREAETSMIERDLRLNRRHQARYHAQHLSCLESVEAIRKARSQGHPATAEASPHHLLLSEDACTSYDPVMKVNPPLRTREDIAAIKAGIAEGVITVLATDQAPHPPQAKETDFSSAAFGMVSIECAVPLYQQALVKDGVIDWPGLIRMMTVAPAALTGLDRKGLGRLAPGGPGDVTLIDPDLPWTIRAADFVSTGRNCPFEGWEVTGRAAAAVVAGEIRWRLTDDRIRSLNPDH